MRITKPHIPERDVRRFRDVMRPDVRPNTQVHLKSAKYMKYNGEVKGVVFCWHLVLADRDIYVARVYNSETDRFVPFSSESYRSLEDAWDEAVRRAGYPALLLHNT